MVNKIPKYGVGQAVWINKIQYRIEKINTEENIEYILKLCDSNFNYPGGDLNKYYYYQHITAKENDLINGIILHSKTIPILKY
jgi:hypothetical protein